MKRLIILISFLLIGLLLFGSEKLRLTISDSPISDIEISDLDQEVEEGGTIEVASSNIIIGIQLRAIDPTEYSVYLNDDKIDGFFEDCAIDFDRLTVFYQLKDLISEGLNELSLYTASDRSFTKWTINVTAKEESIEYTHHFKITYGKGWKRGFTVSPDGNLIAYVVIDNDYNAIRIYNLKDEKTRTVVENEKKAGWGGEISLEEKSRYSFAPCWSRDGAYLYYVSNNTGNFELYRAEIDLNGNCLDQTQLTKYDSYLCNLEYSNLHDRIFFASNKSGKMAIYSGINAETATTISEFCDTVERITPEGDDFSYFSPAISIDDKYLAYCRTKMQEKTSLIIYDLANRSIEYISNDDKDSIFPSWSSAGSYLAFYQGENIELLDFENDDHIHLSSGVRRPKYPVKPCWGPLGDEIYMISTDTNNSVRKIIIDLDRFEVKSENILLDDKYYANNYEVGITPDKNTLIRACFQKNHEIWLSESEMEVSQVNSIVGFESTYKTMLKFWDKSSKKYEPLAIYPKIFHPDVLIEKEDLTTGNYRFLVGEKEFSRYLFSTNETISFKPDPEPSYSITYGLSSTALPALGQHLSKNYEKSKFFLYSFWGLLGLTAGSYYYSDYLYDEYDNQTDMKSLVEARDSYDNMAAVTTGLLVGTITHYILNAYDGWTSTVNKQNEYLMHHNKNFHDVTSNLPVERDMYSKKLMRTGELKILTEEPNLKITLIDRAGKATEYGKTSLVFDTDTYFTITNLNEGDYSLIAEDTFGNKITESVRIDKNVVKYLCLRDGKAKSKNIMNYAKKALPGYTQLKRGDKLKGYSIISLTAASLVGALYCSLAANSEYSDYEDARDIETCLDSRSGFIRNRNMSYTFLASFSLTYLYGYIDSCMEGR